MEREAIEFDVAIVGAGPAGLSAACRLKQLDPQLSVCVLEKGSEVGAHIVSGALLETVALDELFPDWRDRGAPVNTKVTSETLSYLSGSEKAVNVPPIFVPKPLRNQNNYILSLANLCRWLAKQAEALDVAIFSGFPAAAILFSDSGSVVAGVVTGDTDIGKDGHPKSEFQAGTEIRASYTLFAEGCHGHLGKQLIRRFNLRKGVDPQHYGLGVKEIWKINPAKHKPGHVLHTFGWPLDAVTEGGGFLYHIDNHQIALGLIVGLNYANPFLNPFEEMQRWKLHPKIKSVLEGGSRVAYGARAVNKGGFQSLPQLVFPGGLLIGCDAGFLNSGKIRGIHTAMKSGMLAAETVAEALSQGVSGGLALTAMHDKYRMSWLYEELHQTRNIGPALSKWGSLVGGAMVWVDQNLFVGKLPFTLRKPLPDSAHLKPVSESKKIDYPRYDGKITFDILSSVALSNVNHEEDQPCHLRLHDPNIPLTTNFELYDEPAQRYCPAKVYEVLTDSENTRVFRINAQNCIHCKTCDIKDPAQNIDWQPPEGGGGPNYGNM